MSEPKFTPGPLFVRQSDEWPFKIETVNAAGEVIFDESRCAYSTSQKTVKDVMTGYGMHARFNANLQEEAIAANERQLADAYLRAAAPVLFEACSALVESMKASGIKGPYLDAARAALAKALGDQS